MRAFLLLAITLICSSTSLAGDSEAKSNIEIIDRFFATVFIDTAEAKSLLHDDFSFQFMGICTICKSYNKETYVTEWLGKDIPAVLPTGVDLEIVRKIDGGNDVVYIVKGKAQGINGSYNNNYAMVFKMEGGQILDFQEYHSDLLAETRLHKKKIVDIKWHKERLLSATIVLAIGLAEIESTVDTTTQNQQQLDESNHGPVSKNLST